MLSLHVVQECMDSNSTLRLAAFFHDIAKPLSLNSLEACSEKYTAKEFATSEQ